MVKVNVDCSGLSSMGRKLTNYVPRVTDVYYSVNGDGQCPTAVGIQTTLENGSEKALIVPFEGDISKSITKQFPMAMTYSAKAACLVQSFIIEQIQGIRSPENPITGEKITIRKGYSFPGSGTYVLPAGPRIWVWNHRFAGNNIPDVPYQIASDPDVVVPDEVDRPIEKMVSVMLQNDSSVCMALSFGLVTSVHSSIIDVGYPVQGALYITGEQSAGKTTLAQRMFGYPIRRSTGRPALFLEAVSTEAATRDIMAANPDLPVVIDDLCLSSEKSIEKQRRKLGSALLRLAANDASVAKKGLDGRTIHRDCSAGLVLTAEFVLDGMSELTRCIIINLPRRLQLTADLDAKLVGSVVNRFVDWFADHYDDAIELLHQHMAHPETLIERLRLDDLGQRNRLLREHRVQRNLSLLAWAFECFVRMAKSEMELPSALEGQLYQTFWAGIHTSLAKQFEVLAEIDSRKPEGNIAFVILSGIESGEFNLCRRRKKLFTRDGIIWEEDKDGSILIGIKEAALVTFVRNQNGYQNTKAREIVQYLKDRGVLVLQETKTNTVHLGEKKAGEPCIPRVLLIKCEALRDAAQCYVALDV